MNNELSFSIIIPNLNGQNFLIDCLDSLIKSITPIKNITFEFILVDNASTDNSVNIFCRNIPKKYSSKIILNKNNFGFAAAVNQGINSAKHPLVVLVNNDLKVNKDWFPLVINQIEKNKDQNIAAYCGTVLNIDGTKFESQGLKYFMKGKCLNIKNGKAFKKSLLKNKKSKIIWGSSAALVIYEKKIIQDIGLFDEDFFAYEEDVDLSYRLNKSGLRTLLIPSAISYHLGGGTSGQMGVFRNKMDAKNWFFIIIKNYSVPELIKYFPSIFFERLRNLSCLIKAHFYNKNIVSIPFSLISTYATVLLKTPLMIKKRFLYQNSPNKG